MKDLVRNLKLTRILAPTQKTATFSADNISCGITAANGVVTNLMFMIEFTAVAAADASNYVDITFQEGDQSDNSDMTAITAAESERVLREATTAPVTASPQIAYRKNTTATGIIKVGLVIGVKKYVRLVFTETGTTDMTYGILAIQQTVLKPV